VLIQKSKNLAVKTTDLNSLCDALPLRLGIAVSGGADSMALLALLIAEQSKQPRELYVLTVDHALRADSAVEAQNVQDYCIAHGVSHRILHWDHDNPQSAIQQKARQARRQLLIEACLEQGITDLVLAHQADDQAETFFQRLSRGAGLNGLRGMREKISQQGVTIHRPLLSCARADLRHYCVMHDVPFVDDPSNDDTRFERIRWRHILTHIKTHRPDFIEQLLRTQKRLEQADKALMHIAQQWIVTHKTESDGKIILPRDLLSAQPQALIVVILRQLMVTQTDYKVDLERLENWVVQDYTHNTNSALTLGPWWLRVAGNKVTLQAAPARTTKVAS
jgi:tRNA(Ile)-lysidine synthase